MTINTKQCSPVETLNKYKGAICMLVVLRECTWVHAFVQVYWKGALNHSSSMVIDLEVDVNVKISKKKAPLFSA